MKDRIQTLRKSLKLTQTEFGRKIGLSTAAVSDVEVGRRAVQDRHIKLITSAFPQVSEEWLRTGAGPMFIQDDNPIRQIMQRYDFPDIVRQFLEAYNRLDPDEQRAVYKYTTELVTAIVGSGEPRTSDVPAAITEIDVEAETEAYRQQLINQKKAGSSRSPGIGDTEPAIS